MCDKEYNGWKGGYNTWLVALWLGNDEGSDSWQRELAQSAYDNAEADKYFTREERAALDLSDTLKAEIEEMSPAGVTGMYADLLNGALSEVNWHEIAEHLIEDVDKNTEGGND